MGRQCGVFLKRGDPYSIRMGASDEKTKTQTTINEEKAIIPR